MIFNNLKIISFRFTALILKEKFVLVDHQIQENFNHIYLHNIKVLKIKYKAIIFVIHKVLKSCNNKLSSYK